jgi:sugar/nucleoside kinase (ribokinase family)
MERYLKLGMDVAGIQFEQGPTFHWEGVYESDMVNRRTVRTDLGVLETFAPQLPESYRDAPFVLLGNINPDLQLRLLDQARGARFVAVDSMDLWINCARSTLVKVIGRSHLVTLNDGEARQLTGQFNLRQCATALFDMGVEYVLIKKGEHGALLFSREGLAIIPAYPVQEVCDPTGAGDVYAGAFMGYLAEHGSVDPAALRQALLHASAVAAFGVEDLSTTRLEALTRAEIDTRVKELREMTAL